MSPVLQHNRHCFGDLFLHKLPLKPRTRCGCGWDAPSLVDTLLTWHWFSVLERKWQLCVWIGAGQLGLLPVTEYGRNSSVTARTLQGKPWDLSWGGVCYWCGRVWMVVRCYCAGVLPLEKWHYKYSPISGNHPAACNWEAHRYPSGKKYPQPYMQVVRNTTLQDPVQYLAFGWRAVCALVCVDAGRGYSSTKVTLGYARYLPSRRHLHRSKLGSIQLL